jgi:hypothetical protein
MKRLMVFTLLILLFLLAGCTGTAPQAEPATPRTEIPTPQATTLPPTVPPSTFPDALPLKTVTEIGEGTNLREISVYKYLIRDKYEFYSSEWGRWEPVSAPPGKAFLIIFVRVKHIGTVKENSAPYPSVINIHFDDNIYSYKSGRDPLIPINDVRELEYTGGKLYVHETKEGFIIYEVPEGIRPYDTYVTIFVPEGTAPVWKLA